MKNRTKVILVRHGQSIGNLTRTFLGHTDLDLSDFGYIQAQTTANHLKNEKIDAIYSSDLKRAYNTAVPHANLRNIDVIANKNLREAYVGEWEGMKADDIIDKYGIDMFKGEWANNFGCFRFPGGESIKEAGMRFYNEIMTICQGNIGNCVLICAHAAVIRSFWAIISNIPFENIVSDLPFPSNASYSVCSFENGKIIPWVENSLMPARE